MTEREKAVGALCDWFLENRRELPWRDRPDFYRVWISEIMLQQTQVKTVLPYFERFIRRFPDAGTLAKAELSEVLAHWSGLGYYQRAKNLHRAAINIASSGGFPTTLEGWLALPGIGRYTAGAILSIAGNQAYPILDGNIRRIIARTRKIRDNCADKTYWAYSGWFLRTACAIGHQPQTVNQAMMELGALICTPRQPDCGRCPLSLFCKAHRDGLEVGYPTPKKMNTVAVSEEKIAYYNGEGVYLTEQRGAWRNGLLDLPDASSVEKPGLMTGKTVVSYVVTKHRVTRQVLEYELADQTVFQALPEWKWVRFSELRQYPVGAPLLKWIKKKGAAQSVPEKKLH